MSAVDVLTGFTPVPNSFFQAAIQMSEAELRAALAVIQATLGYNVEETPLSIADVQRQSGLSRQGAVAGLKQLKQRRWIATHQPAAGQKTVVRWMGSQRSRPVNVVDQSTELTSQRSRLPIREESAGSQRSRLVNVVDSLYIRQDIKESAAAVSKTPYDPAAAAAGQAELDKLLNEARHLAEQSPQAPAGPPADQEYAGVCRCYQDNIGAPTSIIAEKIRDAIRDYSGTWVMEAIKKATAGEHRSWNYVEGVLRGWRRDGLAQPPTLQPASPPPTQSRFRPANPSCPICHGSGTRIESGNVMSVCPCRTGGDHAVAQ